MYGWGMMMLYTKKGFTPLAAEWKVYAIRGNLMQQDNNLKVEDVTKSGISLLI